MEVGDWLRNLGLERYEPAFRRNHIDGEVLLKLTAEDLRELGVEAAGDRRRLLEAIRSLPQAAATPPGFPAVQAERRQLTVMFCDLVDSTTLASRLDPEDVRQILGAYHGWASGVITGAGGFVAKFLGDGGLAYFRYPHAGETDADGAVRAGLALVEGISGLQTVLKEPLQVRVGIATGLVVVGDLMGEGAARVSGVIGETPNLAARLQDFAEP